MFKLGGTYLDIDALIIKSLPLDLPNFVGIESWEKSYIAAGVLRSTPFGFLQSFQSAFYFFKFYHNLLKSSSTVLILVPNCFIYLCSANMSRKSKSLLAMMYFQKHGFM